MRKITRRPNKKKRPNVKAARNRHAKRERREHQRKLKRKLLKIIDKIGLGYYDGVKDSPLMKANFGFVQSQLKQRLQIRSL